MEKDVLNQLYETIKSRKSASSENSYVASLFAKNTRGIGNKVIEEAVETVVEAHEKNPQKLAEESADLLFHLMVLLAHKDVDFKDVIDVLDKRNGISGHTEKAARA